MCMGILLALIMTFSVENKNTVQPSGNVPPSVEAAYSCTYQKGTVRAGDEAQLVLTGIGGMTIESVELSMRSNRSGGAGTITVTADGATVATKSGSFRDWTGAFDGTSYHMISVLTRSVQVEDELTVSVQGTENSLYIERFVITVQEPPAHTVTLMKGVDVYSTLTESESGAGVLLPMMNDTAEWHFIGWSEREFYTEYQVPDKLYTALNTMHLDEDKTLWACYIYRKEEEDTYVTELQSGIYLYVNSEMNFALSGIPEGGRMKTGYADSHNSKQYYQIEFVEPDTAYITHLESNSPIGHSGTNLRSISTPWLVYHEGEETQLYTYINGKRSVLWLNMLDSETQAYYTGLFSAEQWENSPMRLMYPQEEEEPAYTCHPECGVAIETVPGGRRQTNDKVLMLFGDYELRMTNGKKELRLRK